MSAQRGRGGGYLVDDRRDGVCRPPTLHAARRVFHNELVKYHLALRTEQTDEGPALTSDYRRPGPRRGHLGSGMTVRPSVCLRRSGTVNGAAGRHTHASRIKTGHKDL